MTIEIHDETVQARLRRHMELTGSSSTEETLSHLLDTQEERDRWLAENRAIIGAKIRRGIEQLDRGEGIGEDQLASHLAQLKLQAG